MATMEIIRKRKRIRMRFRGIIRVVLLRKTALPDQEQDKHFMRTIKQNITTFIRRQNKFSTLTKVERAILSKPYWERTIEEKRDLVKLYATLDCFSAYPPKVRARMAPYLHYMRADSGRYLIKAGHRPMHVYFILNGEILYTKTEYDPIKNIEFQKYMYLGGPGDAVGISAFIINAVRNRTVLVLSTLEALYMDGDDFMRTLAPTIKNQYEQKKRAISKFEILNFFDAGQFLYAMQYGILRKFQPMESMYCLQDKGEKYVYFIVSGQCMILQSLQVRARQLTHRKIYELIETNEIVAEDNSNDPVNRSKNYIAEKIKELDEVDVEDKENSKEASNLKVNSNFVSLCVVEEEQIQKRISKSHHKPEIEVLPPELIEKEISKISTHRESIPLPEPLIYTKGKSKWKKETHFIDVGSFSLGAIFGLGEVMNNRAIMARSEVQCYMLPRYWLYEKHQNPGNIWQQIQYNLDSTVPSEKKLYKVFLDSQKWDKLKTDYINSLLAPSNLTSKIQDIPAYCRVIESTYSNNN